MRCFLVAVTALLVCAPAAMADAGPSPDYRVNPGRSEPLYRDIERTVVRLPAALDGEQLYIEVVKPKGVDNLPVILEASPYHGTLADRDGTRILPEPTENGKPIGMTGYFAPRGYAVVMFDLRGTGRSEGCLDHLGPKDASDLKQVVEWAADQDWSNGRVGMTGHSYVGSTPSVAAAQNPRGLATIVPSAGLASMYHHQFQAGVPYFLQWAGPIEAYEQLAIERNLPPFFADPFGLTHPGDNFPPPRPEQTGCGLPQSAAVAGEDQLSGRYTELWHQPRDHGAGATNANIPVFAVHGVNDNAARVAALDWFHARKAAGTNGQDKLWLGQWDHGSGCCPTRRGLQWTAVLHSWFDKHLMGRNVSTGPPIEVFLGDGTFAEARAGARTEILTDGSWPPPAGELKLFPTSDGKLSSDPGADGSVSFQGDPSGHSNPKSAEGATFTSEPLTSDRVLVGIPDMTLAASVTAPRVHLIVNLFEERASDGDWRRITQCTLNPELRNGLDKRENVTPGERYDLKPPCFAMGHHVRAGNRLVLKVQTADPDKVPMFAVDPQVTVFTGPSAGGAGISLPSIDGATLYPDTVGLSDTFAEGPAQASLSCTATVPLPGAGLREIGATSEVIEFDVRDDRDNAQLKIFAKPKSTADVDLYLQRQGPDGEWGDDITSGGSSSTSEETLTYGRLAAGRYRVEVHNWAGPPNLGVDVTIDFINQQNQKGRDGGCEPDTEGNPSVGPSAGAAGGAAGAGRDFVLSNLRAKRTRFRAGRKQTALTAQRRRRTPVGTTFRWHVNRKSLVRVRFQKVKRGRFVNGQCVKPRGVRRSAPKCKRYLNRGRVLRRRSEEGAGKMRFNGRMGRHKPLRARLYRAVFQAIDYPERSNRGAIAFRIVKR